MSERPKSNPNYYRGLSALAGTATLLGTLVTLGSLCGAVMPLIESPSQPGAFLSKDIPTFLACTGGSALFTIASAVAWSNFSEKAPPRKAKPIRLHSEPDPYSNDWWSP